MAESPADLLRSIRDEFRDLPQRLADQLGKQREMVLRGEIPGERREREEGEGERPGGGERPRDAQGRFLPGDGKSHQGAFARAAGIDQELLNAGKHLGFVAGGPLAKMAAQVQHAESLFNAIDRFQKALAKSREPKEESPAGPKQKNEPTTVEPPKEVQYKIPTFKVKKEEKHPEVLPAPKPSKRLRETFGVAPDEDFAPVTKQERYPLLGEQAPKLPVAQERYPLQGEKIPVIKARPRRHRERPLLTHKSEVMGQTRERRTAGMEALQRSLRKIQRPAGGVPPAMLPKAPKKEILPGLGEQQRPTLPVAPRTEREASAGQDPTSLPAMKSDEMSQLDESLKKLNENIAHLNKTLEKTERGTETSGRGAAGKTPGQRGRTQEVASTVEAMPREDAQDATRKTTEAMIQAMELAG